jgi:hypothetical protein
MGCWEGEVEGRTGAAFGGAAREEGSPGFSTAMIAGLGLKVTFLFVFFWASELADRDGIRGVLSILAAEEAIETQ